MCLFLLKYRSRQGSKLGAIKHPLYNSRCAFPWVVMTRNFEAWEVVKNKLVTSKLFIESNNRTPFDDKKKARVYEAIKEADWLDIKTDQLSGFSG